MLSDPGRLVNGVSFSSSVLCFRFLFSFPIHSFNPPFYPLSLPPFVYAFIHSFMYSFHPAQNTKTDGNRPALPSLCTLHLHRLRRRRQDPRQNARTPPSPPTRRRRRRRRLPCQAGPAKSMHLRTRRPILFPAARRTVVVYAISFNALNGRWKRRWHDGSGGAGAGREKQAMLEDRKTGRKEGRD